MEEDFEFDYGIITVNYRFNLERDLSEYKETIYDKVIQLTFSIKVNILNGKERHLLEILYRDENNKLKYKNFDITEYTVKVKHKGNMTISI